MLTVLCAIFPAFFRVITIAEGWMQRLKYAAWFVILTAPPIFCADLEEVLAKHYEAIGGLEKLRSIKSMKVTGTITTSTGTLSLVFHAKSNMCRIDVKSEGLSFVKIFDGKRGWEINPALGTQEPQVLNAKQTRNLKRYLDLSGHLVDWEEKGSKAEYRGSEKIDGQAYHRVFLETPYDLDFLYYINPDTQMIERMVERSRSQKWETLVKLLEYTTVDGIRFMKSYQAGTREECDHSIHKKDSDCNSFRWVTYHTREVNPVIGDMLFCIESTKSAYATDQ